MSMKMMSIVVLGLLVAGIAFYHFGGRVRTDRHRIAECELQIPKDEPPVLAEILVLRGIAEALQINRFDAANWIPIRREVNGSVLRIGNDTNVAIVTLTNKNHVGYLFARVKLDATNRILNVVVSRSK